MSNCIKIFYRIAITNKNSFTACLLKSWIVSFSFGSESINGFKGYWASVNRKPVIIGNSYVFSATAIFLAIIPTFVITRAVAIFRAFREGGADIFLDYFMLIIQDYVCTLPGSYSREIFLFVLCYTNQYSC